MADLQGGSGDDVRHNGAWAWASRLSSGTLLLLLTIIGTMALGSLNNLTTSVAGMGEEIKAIRGELSDLRQTLVGNYMTREETTILIEASEQRLRRRIDREHPARRAPQ